MLEIKVTIETPELARAIVRLADALSGAQFLGATEAVEAPTAINVAALAENEPQAEPLERPQETPQESPVEAPVDEAPAAEPEIVNTPLPTAEPEITAQIVPDARDSVAENVVSEEAKVYTLDDIANAMAELIDAGQMSACMATIRKYGVPAINLLKAEQYPAFAEDLKALGAKF
jgi:hypothetical protein